MPKPSFSEASKQKLNTCHPDLIRVFNRVIDLGWDCQILEGHRGKIAQNAAYAAGNSQLKWPNGNHNKLPSDAVDVGPYVVRPGFKGVPWPDKKLRPKTYNADLAMFYLFAGVVMGVAAEMGVKLRWGGDWDSDKDLTDQTFNDLVHWEVVN